MDCRLALYRPKWDSKIRNFTLDETQKRFVSLPCTVIDFSIQDNNRYPVVILLDEEPVGFFVLHQTEEIQSTTASVNTILLRAFSIDKNLQGKGLAKSAMRSLPMFVSEHFPQIEEIILAVNENNEPAKRLYEKAGFRYNGKSKVGRSGTELIMYFHL